MHYSTILFDADDTLLDFRRAEQAALHEVFARFGLRTDEAFLQDYVRINDELWSRFSRGEIEKEEITSTRFVRLFDRHRIALDGVLFNEWYLDCLAQYGYTLPGAVACCKKLSETHQLYIITNGIGRVQKSRFAGSGLAPYFDGVFVSETVGAGKPHRAFFDAVLAAIPERDKRKILVVGDSLQADIQGGLQAGLPTCWCDFKKTNAPNKAQYRAESFEQILKIAEAEI